MIDKINSLLIRVEEFRPKAEAEIEEFRVRMLGRKGEMNELFEEFKQVAPELKKELGQRINALKNTIAETITRYKTEMENRPEAAGAGIDMTRPGTADRIGSRHPISLVRNQIVDIFTRLGYTVAEGPEIEDDWHVFSALNFPPEHPARDMQDTFFIAKNPAVLLRTHTSSIQVRTMERQKPPIRMLAPGRVFRKDEADATHSPMFHQIEGLVVDEGITMGDLKGALETLIKRLHLTLKNGTSDSRKDWFAVGEYKRVPNEVGGRDTTAPEKVEAEISELLSGYNAVPNHTLEQIIAFHHDFECIHPFQDGNGRIGRLILFKECLKNNIVPFIIEDDLKMFYYRGLHEWNHEHGYLVDTCLTAQDRFKAYLDYFRIPYSG